MYADVHNEHRVRRAMERYYAADQQDNDLLFLEVVEKWIKPDSRVLDAGAGDLL